VASVEQGCILDGTTGLRRTSETTFVLTESQASITAHRTAWPLRVQVVNPLQGRAFVGGAACEGGCTRLIPVGELEYVTAEPLAGSVVSFSGTCEEDAAGCAFSSSAPGAVVVTFSKQVLSRLTLQVEGDGRVAGPGLDCGADGGACSQELATGTNVVLVASRADVRWSIPDCPGRDCSFTLSGDRLVTASFAASLVSVSLAQYGSDAGGVIFDGVFSALPLLRSVPLGSSHSVRAVAPEDDTPVGYDGIQCGPAAGTCSFVADRAIDAGVHFAHLVGWLRAWHGAAEVGDILGLPDGGALAIASFTADSTDVAGTPMARLSPPSNVENVVFEIDENQQFGSTSRTSGFGFDGQRVSLTWEGAHLRVAGELAGPPWLAKRLAWGSIDAGFPARLGSDFGILELDRTSLLPIDGRFMVGAASREFYQPLPRFEALSLEDGFDVPVSWADQNLTPHGLVLSMRPSASPMVVFDGPMLASGFVGGVRKLVTRDSTALPCGSGAPLYSWALLSLDSGWACVDFVELAAPPQRATVGAVLAVDGGVVFARAFNETRPRLELVRQGSPAWVATQQFAQSVPYADEWIVPRALFPWGNDYLSVWFVRGDVEFDGAAEALCGPVAFPAFSSAANLVLTVHSGETGALKWIHCFPSRGASTTDGFAFQRRSDFNGRGIALVGAGLLLSVNRDPSGVDPAPVQVGSTRLSLDAGVNNYLLFVRPPRW
jgi:hypothetical protein